MNFRHLLREDIALSVKGNSDNDTPKTYAEYLDAQIKAAQQNKADFSKADDKKISSLARDYATLAKNKFSRLEGQPKNDTEANNMLVTSIQKNKMDNAADNAGGDENAIKKAEQNINDAIKDLQESIFENGLNEYGRRLLENAEKTQLAGILIMNTETGEILVCHPTPVYSLHNGSKGNPLISWGIPKGHVEDGEDTRDAAFREFEEETSIDLRGENIILLGKYKYSYNEEISVYLYATDDVKFYKNNCRCGSTFEKWGQEWDENDNYDIYNIRKPDCNRIRLSKGTSSFIEKILEDYPVLR